MSWIGDELSQVAFMRLSSGPKPLKQDLIMKIKEQYVCPCPTVQMQPNGFSLDQLAIMDILCTYFFVLSEVDTINRMYKTKWTVYQLDGRTSKDPNSVNPRCVIDVIAMQSDFTSNKRRIAISDQLRMEMIVCRLVACVFDDS